MAVFASGRRKGRRKSLLRQLIPERAQGEAVRAELRAQGGVVCGRGRTSRALEQSERGPEGVVEIMESGRSGTRTEAAQIFLMGRDSQTLTLAADTHSPGKVGRV